MGGTINTKQITDHWDELLRLTASLRLGTVTASLLLRKLASYPRQVAAIILWNTLELARAVEELQQEGMHITGEQLAHLSPMD